MSPGAERHSAGGADPTMRSTVSQRRIPRICVDWGTILRHAVRRRLVVSLIDSSWVAMSLLTKRHAFVHGGDGAAHDGERRR